MAPVVNSRVIFNSIPQGFPEPGKTIVYDTSENIDVEKVPLNGGLLIKVLKLSVDPYMRNRMREPSIKSYREAFVVGKPLNGFGVGRIVRSEFSGAKTGDHVIGILEHQNFVIRRDLQGLQVLQNPYKLPLSAFLGVLGMPGKTAFMAWKEYSHAKQGETVFVSAGAGPVGSLVIQLAKMDGLKVIGSAGSEEKVQFMKEVGADVAFNYKTTNVSDVLAKEGPIDIYWDNVGGETLDAALDAASVGARFIECGMISAYNTPGGTSLKNLGQVVSKSITLQGFIVHRLYPKYENDFFETMPGKVASGEIKYREDVYNGIDKVGEVLLLVLMGKNKAKAIVHVADD